MDSGMFFGALTPEAIPEAYIDKFRDIDLTATAVRVDDAFAALNSHSGETPQVPRVPSQEGEEVDAASQCALDQWRKQQADHLARLTEKEKQLREQYRSNAKEAISKFLSSRSGAKTDKEQQSSGSAAHVLEQESYDLTAASPKFWSNVLAMAQYDNSPSSASASFTCASSTASSSAKQTPTASVRQLHRDASRMLEVIRSLAN